MKKILIFILVLAGIFNSCELEEKIYDKYTPQTVYTNEAGVRAGVVGAYSIIRHWQMYKNFAWYLPILGHDLNFPAQGGVFFPASDRSLLDNANNMVKNVWDYAYIGIEHANQVIAFTEGVEALSDEKKAEYIGHGYFLRAFNHFEIYRRHGKGIIKTEPSTAAELNKPISSGAELLAQVISDFQAASERLPAYSEQDNSLFGLATKGAADALLGLAYIHAGEYHNAINAFDAVINSGEYELIDWDELWVDESKKRYNEVIFAIQFINDPNASAVPSLGADLGSRFIWANDARTKGFNTFRLQRWFYRYATTGVHDGDYRNEVLETVTPNKDNADNPLKTWPLPDAWGDPPGTDVAAHSPRVSGKFIDPDEQDDGRNKSYDYFYIRYAEVLFLKAEALNELNGGPTQEAVDLINQVRARARRADGTARPDPVDLTLADVPSSDDFRTLLVNEKAVEFVGEGKRWWDLRRIKRDNGDSMYKYILTEWLPNYQYGPNSDDYVGYTNRAKVALNYYERDEWLPIASTEIQNNPLVTDADQNPGW